MKLAIRKVGRKFSPYLWVRVMGKRIGIMRHGDMPALFSERYGHTRVWRALGWKIKVRPARADEPRFFGGLWLDVYEFDVPPIVFKEF